MENSSNNERQQDLLRRYQKNQCTPQEREHVEKWYEGLGSTSSHPETHEYSSLKKVRRNILASIQESRPVKSVWSIQPFVRVAAIVFIFLGAVILLLQLNRRNQIYDQEFFAKAGEIKTIILPDSSVIKLNADSKLRIQYSVNDNLRAITLSGEASFQVSKDPQRPFQVITDKITTRVLGTTFNVQAYDNDQSVIVTVAEGKVSVAEQNEGTSMNLSSGLVADQQLVYNKHTKHAELRSVDSQRILEWSEGLVYFENESVQQIALKLQRKYGAVIRVVGEANSECLYTFALRDESLLKALEILQTVSGTQIVKNKYNQLIFNTIACK
jgi:transmembrane sensor